MWLLILFAHVGLMGDGNSNSLATAEFTSQQTCQVAGKAAKKMSEGTVKQIDFVCVQK